MVTSKKQLHRERRAQRARSVITGTGTTPRVSVFASSNGIFAQFIDDTAGVTIVSGRDKGLSGTKTERAAALGETLGKQAAEKGIKKIVFDRGPKQYHGRIRAFADGLRKEGLLF